MQERNLGKSNLEVAAVGLGCTGMSFGYGPGDVQSFPSLAREELPTTRVRRSGWSKIFSCFRKRNLY